MQRFLCRLLAQYAKSRGESVKHVYFLSGWQERETGERVRSLQLCAEKDLESEYFVVFLFFRDHFGC